MYWDVLFLLFVLKTMIGVCFGGIMCFVTKYKYLSAPLPIVNESIQNVRSNYFCFVLFFLQLKIVLCTTTISYLRQYCDNITWITRVRRYNNGATCHHLNKDFYSTSIRGSFHNCVLGSLLWKKHLCIDHANVTGKQNPQINSLLKRRIINQFGRIKDRTN